MWPSPSMKRTQTPVITIQHMLQECVITDTWPTLLPCRGASQKNACLLCVDSPAGCILLIFHLSIFQLPLTGVFQCHFKKTKTIICLTLLTHLIDVFCKNSKIHLRGWGLLYWASKLDILTSNFVRLEGISKTSLYSVSEDCQSTRHASLLHTYKPICTWCLKLWWFRVDVLEEVDNSVWALV